MNVRHCRQDLQLLDLEGYFLYFVEENVGGGDDDGDDYVNDPNHLG
jgi:hypothetical protein